MVRERVREGEERCGCGLGWMRFVGGVLRVGVVTLVTCAQVIWTTGWVLCVRNVKSMSVVLLCKCTVRI